jgi:hypothetical protein
MPSIRVAAVRCRANIDAVLRLALIIIICTAAITAAPSQSFAQTMQLSTTSSDYEVTAVFSEVTFFTIDIEIDAALAPGIYINPDIISVTYQVTGSLEPDTPSGFPAFDLQRNMTGAEFYAQGSSLSFEIAPSAVLSDGIQAAELVGNGPILTFNAREVGTGRFHPPLLELRANGIGRLQNSDNVPIENPRVEVNFGEEYITDLIFDPGNTTLITDPPEPPPDNDDSDGVSGIYVSCFIATAAYGSYLEPEVRLLRDFRDEWLLPYRPGQAFVAWYYRTSPPVANYIAERDWLRTLTRMVLTPLVYAIKYPAGFTVVLILAGTLLLRRSAI